jgi:UDP-glucose 6-dehydrogenase
VPEFLRDQHAKSDFKYAQEILIVGTNDLEIYTKICDLYRVFVENSVQMSPVESEMLKYFINTFNGLRVTFANVFYDSCCAVGADYSKILNAATKKSVIGHDHYLKCNNSLRGYQGKCLPKDIEAFSTFLNKIDCQNNIFPSIINDNKKYTQ